ncbi:hypothetical protein BT93_F1851 [Corymbia citriodora subsp. variegata]|nr:hypothetical protein BT93_F1851 [Corymbia citriodora subsp. variegata]
MLRSELYDQAHKLRQMKGEDLEGLNVEELGQLEKKLEAGLSLVINTKEERTLNEINKLQRKMKMTLHREKLVTVNSELINNVSISSNSTPPLDGDSPNSSRLPLRS